MTAGILFVTTASHGQTKSKYQYHCQHSRHYPVSLTHISKPAFPCVCRMESRTHIYFSFVSLIIPEELLNFLEKHLEIKKFFKDFLKTFLIYWIHTLMLYLRLRSCF